MNDYELIGLGQSYEPIEKLQAGKTYYIAIPTDNKSIGMTTYNIQKLVPIHNIYIGLVTLPKFGIYDENYKLIATINN